MQESASEKGKELFETPINVEQKTLCCFAIDVSESMGEPKDNPPIAALNKGLSEFQMEIADNSVTRERLEIAVVSFSDEINVVVAPELAKSVSIPALRAAGTTCMVDGVRKAIEIVERRKEFYDGTGQPRSRPWVVLITDGNPDGNQDIDGLAREIEEGTKSKKFMFLPIAVKGANMDVLNKIAGYEQKGEKKEWTRLSPLQLDGLKFHEFFEWLSQSMQLVAGTNPGGQVALPVPDWIGSFNN